VDKSYFFDRNLLALSAHNPALCSRLSTAETTRGCYKFLESQSGEVIPALVDRSGAAHALHSTVDPAREAARLISSLKDGTSHDHSGGSGGDFVVFFGLGGGFAPGAALNSGDVSQVLVIDYDINGIAELFCSREYIALLGDPRFTLLVDPPPDLVETSILELYRPALCGGIRVLPLRTRTDLDKQNFNAAGDAIQSAIEKVSSDYSVQAYFGMRWFSNIIRNLNPAGLQNRSIRPVREAAICAAGPSLDDQIPLLLEQKQKRELFVISADTALGALLCRGLRPDAVVSIDCQHISYYHFMGTDCADIPLFLDISSPPLLSKFSNLPFFFSGGHPLAAYVSQEWRPLPLLDTSGGNVTHACLSLAESLGAQRITVYGADFSYPAGRVYARGTYIYPYFERRQKRLSPLEAQLSSFLYRAPFLPPEVSNAVAAQTGLSPYETAALRRYRESFVKKASAMEAEVSAAQGWGIPLLFGRKPSSPPSVTRNRVFNLFAPGKMIMDANRFLEQYRRGIEALPLYSPEAFRGLDLNDRRIFITMMPIAAAFRHRHPELSIPDMVEEVKRYCVNEIDRVVNNR
jgi:hypothetical protein